MIKKNTYGIFIIATIIFGLQIPLLYSLPIAGFAIYFLRAQNFVQGKDIIIFVLLISYIFSYYFTATTYGYKSGVLGLKEGAYLFFTYLCFRFLPYSDENIRTVLFVLVSASVVYVFATIYRTYTFDPSLLLVHRQAIGYWSGVQQNTPFLGLLLVPSLVLPFLLILRIGYKPSVFGKLGIVVGFLASSYCVLLLQGRGPFLCALLVYVTLFAVFAYYSPRSISPLLGGLVFAVLFGGFAFEIVSSEVFENYLLRLEYMKLESDRYRSWGVGMDKLFDSPLGGRPYDLGSSYLHNAYLDINYDVGLLPAILLVSVTCVFGWDFVSLVRSTGNDGLKAIILICSASFTLPFFFEPVVNGSLMLFQMWLASMAVLRLHRVRARPC